MTSLCNLKCFSYFEGFKLSQFSLKQACLTLHVECELDNLNGRPALPISLPSI